MTRGDHDLTIHQERVLARGHRLIGDFAQEYLRFRRLGWTHREIAAELGYQGGKKTVGRLATRARHLGLLPREAVTR